MGLAPSSEIFHSVKMPFHVYILECANRAFYVGYTLNIDDRVKAHNAGKGATYTRRNGPVVLVYSEPYATELEAMRREKQLKGWSRKEAGADQRGCKSTPRACKTTEADRSKMLADAVRSQTKTAGTSASKALRYPGRRRVRRHQHWHEPVGLGAMQ